MNTQAESAVIVSGSERTGSLIAAVVALALGAGLVFATGFAGASTIHNAAHDTRHSLSFPCH